MIIWSSINCPIVICLPTVCYFTREKTLVKTTTPGSLSHIICLCYLLLFAFIFRSINLKIQKYFVALYFICDLFIQSITTFFPLRTNFWHRYLKGIDNPFNTSGCEDLLSVCRGYLRCVAWFSYWFDNLGFFTEGNTHLRCATSSLPLWGNTDIVLADRSFSGAIVKEWQRAKALGKVDTLETYQPRCWRLLELHRYFPKEEGMM